MLNIHFTRVSDLALPDHVIISPSVPISGYRDGFAFGYEHARSTRTACDAYEEARGVCRDYAQSGTLPGLNIRAGTAPASSAT